MEALDLQKVDSTVPLCLTIAWLQAANTALPKVGSDFPVIVFHPRNGSIYFEESSHYTHTNMGPQRHLGSSLYLPMNLQDLEAGR